MIEPNETNEIIPQRLKKSKKYSSEEAYRVPFFSSVYTSV
jgi:hypothetical protein